MREHVGRVFSALVVLPLLYAAVRYLPAPHFAQLVALVVLISQVEFSQLALQAGGSPSRSGRLPVLAIGVLGGAVLLVIMYHRAWSALPLWATVLTMGVGVAALAEENLREALPDAALAVFGVWYVAWLFGHVIWLRGLRGGEMLVLFAFWVTWLGDIAAYYVGRAVGRTPLAPRVSPKKTVAGAVGALVGGVIASLIAVAWFVEGFTWMEAVGLGLGGASVGMIGDLVESLWKRSAGVKDSGGWIPAHGGMLDKIDGLVFTVPALYYYVWWVKGAHGVGG